MCYACIRGTYKPALGNASCTTCPDNTFTEEDGRTRVDECVCNAGFSKHGNASAVCAQCTIATYKPGLGNEECTGCPDGDRHTTLAQGAIAQEECVCQAGFFNESALDDECTPCAMGTFKAEASHAQCTACAENATTLEEAQVVSLACVCKAGFAGVYFVNLDTNDMDEGDEIQLMPNAWNRVTSPNAKRDHPFVCKGDL